MPRYIDADALMREVEKAENSMEYHGQEFSYSFLSRGQEISTEWYYVEELIDHAPTADVVERKKGEWIDEPVYKQTIDGKTWDGFTYCSKCKQMHEYGYRSNFCPNCGASMRKETEDAEVH